MKNLAQARVFITGGAGFLGLHLANWLLSEGALVAILDNYATSSPAYLPNHDRFYHFEGRVQDQGVLKQILSAIQPTHVIHAAASYQDIHHWQEDIATNTLGTVMLLDALTPYDIQQLFYLQTALAYGHATHPPIPANHPLAPFNSYGISKVAGELYTRMQQEIPTLTLRIANVYGPRTFIGPMPAFYKRIRARQACHITNTRRDFIEVDDFIALFAHMLEHPGSQGEYNIASGKDAAIADIYYLMCKMMNATDMPAPTIAEPLSDDVGSLLLDATALKQQFHWEPQITLETGLSRLIAWYDTHGVEKVYSHLKVNQEKV